MARKRASVTELTQILNSQINSSGEGEHKIIQEILDPQTANKPPSEIYELMKAFNEVILHQETLVNRLSEMSDKVSNLIERVDKFDEASKRWEEDRQKFLEEIQQKAEALKIKDPDEMDKFLAERTKELQEIYAEVRAKIITDDKKRYEALDSEPTEVVRGVGTIQRVSRNGVVHEEIVPDAIQIGRRVYVFPPNQEVEVPKSVADEYRLLCRERELMERRKRLLSYDNARELGDLVREWNALSTEYNDPSEPMGGV